MLPLTCELLRLAAVIEDDVAAVALPRSTLQTSDLPSPEIEFDWDGGVGEFECLPILLDCKRLEATYRFRDAFTYLNTLLPMKIRALDSTSFVVGVKVVQLGELDEPKRLVTGSSPHAARVIRLAAKWATVDNRHIAGVLLHESIHQFLYFKEKINSPLRQHSLGYSPWKFKERQGRLVWHGFWTFVVQVAFLLETLADGELSGNAFREIAEDFARLEICIKSFEIFELIAAPAEKARIKQAMHELTTAVLLKSRGIQSFVHEISVERGLAIQEFNAWAAGIITERCS